MHLSHHRRSRFFEAMRLASARGANDEWRMTNGFWKMLGSYSLRTKRLGPVGFVSNAPTASRRHSRLPVCATTAPRFDAFKLKRPFGVRHSSLSRGFTLIEIMVVVAIMAVILGAGIPSLYGFFHKEGLRKTMSDLIETCQSARAQAIMTGSTAEMVIHPKEGTISVGAAGDVGYGAWAHSAKVEGGKIEALRINNSRDDFSQAEEVHVRFFANGTCDEMVLLLISDQNQVRGISLEITTGIATVLSDADIRAFAR